ncbi:MAG: DUF6898 family protein [Alphaproteobacteria bacterium]
MKDNSVIFEFQQIGHYVKVMAMDPVTLTEVSIVAPANARKQVLQNNAMRKLKYVIEKKKKEAASESPV